MRWRVKDGCDGSGGSEGMVHGGTLRIRITDQEVCATDDVVLTAGTERIGAAVVAVAGPGRRVSRKAEHPGRPTAGPCGLRQL
ncbi:MAG: hypothetical protein Q4C47_04425 [Planctomycetia bacterium]|nr:hypothetical protein [Planctomycetia bacterium]